MNELGVRQEMASAGAAKLIYALYLASIIVGFTLIIGVAMAYIKRGTAPVWLKSHYQFQIRTFWIGQLYCLLGLVFAFFIAAEVGGVGGATVIFLIIASLLLLLWVSWLLVRCVRGMLSLGRNEAHPNPTGWLF